MESIYTILFARDRFPRMNILVTEINVLFFSAAGKFYLAHGL